MYSRLVNELYVCQFSSASVATVLQACSNVGTADSTANVQSETTSSGTRRPRLCRGYGGVHSSRPLTWQTGLRASTVPEWGFCGLLFLPPGLRPGLAPVRAAPPGVLSWVVSWSKRGRSRFTVCRVILMGWRGGSWGLVRHFGS